jgi:hypothetical protein
MKKRHCLSALLQIMERRHNMADYGVISKLRQMLKDNYLFQQQGISDNIHVAIPPQASYPMIVLELEEIWSSMKLGETAAHIKLKFKASMMSNTPNTKDAVTIAETVRSEFDGKTVDVSESISATLKLSGSIIDMPGANKTQRCVHQYYEALIRG